jgi:hypothetical protein
MATEGEEPFSQADFADPWGNSTILKRIPHRRL